MNNSLNNFFKYTVLLIIVSTGISFSQLDPNNITQFTEKDGVPGSQVSTILSDKFGFIWLGTINGLARYDGYEFKRFYNDPNDPTSIKGLIVWSLFEDSEGRIWVSSSPENLNVYNPITKSFRQFEYKHLIERAANVEIGITQMCEDDKGRVYLGVNSSHGEVLSSALLYFAEETKQVKKFLSTDSLVIQNILSLTKDKNGNVWVLSYNGLFKIDNDRQLTRIRYLDEDNEKNKEYLTDVKCDKSGDIWTITNRSRLYKLNAATGNYKSYYQSKFDKSNFSEFSRTILAFDKNENIWIGSSQGLYYFDREKEKYVGFESRSKNPLEDAYILDLKFDSFGSIWIGTFMGVFKYEERAVLKSYSFNSSDKNSITPGWANHIYESIDGKIWITTSGQGNNSGINIFDQKTGSIKPIPFQNLLPGSYIVFGLFEKAPNEFLFSTVLGLFQYSSITNEVKKITLSGVPASIFIYQFVNDRFENLWLCTSDGLYKRSKGEENFKRYDLALLKGGNASSNEITGAFESKKHGLWLLTPNGLFLYNYTTDKIERHGFDKTKGDILISQDINSLCEDSNGNVWVGAWQGGLSKYSVESKKIKTYTRNDGLPSMSVQGILEDEKNNVLWLSTFEGLSRFDVKTEQFNNFSIADGIQSQLFSDGAYLKTSQGLFIFGGANGITIFSFNDVNNNSIPPKVFLTDLKLFNKSIIPGDNSILEKPIYETKEITLAHDQNNISLEFTALHYSNPNKNTTLYRLENFENVWRDAGSQHSAFYPNLSPGKYLFRVKAANNNGVWNEEGASLKIIIKSPWYQTWWAYLLYIIGFVSLLGGLRKFELDRRREKENKKFLQIENDRKTKELEEARQLQLSMLPKELPKLPNLDIAVYMKTATEVGGDYYDFNVSPDGTLTVAIGDATGHGMKAGTIVSMVKALFSSGGSRMDMKAFFDQSSDALKEIELGRLMMAFMMIKIKSNKIEIANAGMPPLFIYRKQTNTVEEIMINGMPLGAIKNFPYEIKETEISTGDTILLLSDGLPELKNDKNEQYGYERVKQEFKTSAEKSPDAIVEHFKSSASKWANGVEPDDDVTFVVIKIR